MVTESHALVTSSSAADLLTTFTKPANPFTIDLSNNYIGNTFRLQMEAEAKVASNMAPFKGVVSVHVVTSQNTVQAQLQDLENMVGQQPDAIIIDAGSATGLNGVIAKACAAKIVVVSFDQQVTAPCAWKIGTDFGSIEAELATWLVTVMHDKGQIAVDRGLPGTPIADQMLSTELSVYKKFPGIKIVGEFNGNYAGRARAGGRRRHPGQPSRTSPGRQATAGEPCPPSWRPARPTPTSSHGDRPRR